MMADNGWQNGGSERGGERGERGERREERGERREERGEIVFENGVEWVVLGAVERDCSGGGRTEEVKEEGREKVRDNV
uniref:Uncharacterized protein n=1 Tax=Nelumbo nucifera TaxID=4432 RepID=A0A822Z9J7_NELNU|nr:TPA_asm: hypothetical protein HUJ06_015860 [Nelumbo nucifera]